MHAAATGQAHLDLVGHSTGAQYVRTFAGRYPEQVAGIVLLDGRTLSTNSSHRVVSHAHDALVSDQTAVEASSRAILDVVHAVRFGAPLERS